MPHTHRPTSKITLQCSLLMLFLFLLLGCSPVTPGATPGPAITPTLQVKVMPTSTTISLPTTSPIPTIALTETLPSGSPSVEPTEEIVTVPGLRMAYIVDGNLYVQDSGGPYKQLTWTEMDSKPVISDDGQKLLFLRSNHPEDTEYGLLLDLYSINVDGSGEQVLLTYEKLKEIDAQQYSHRRSHAFFFSFIHGTHQAVIHTAIPDSDGNQYNNEDLFWADTDSGQLRQLAAAGEGRNWGQSPDGRQLAFQRTINGYSTGQLDLIAPDGKVIHPDIFASMFSDEAHKTYQNYVSVRWVADGSRLLAVTGDPLDLPRMGRSIWQYSMADGSVTRIEFTPSPSTFMFDISPDGEWIAYTHFTAMDEHDDSYGVYLGNLRTGVTRKLASRENYQAGDEYAWIPDNTHFYFSDSFTSSRFMGDIHGNVEPVGDRFHFLGWIDNRHYICGVGCMGEVGKTERERFIAPPRPLAGYDGFDFVLLK